MEIDNSLDNVERWLVVDAFNRPDREGSAPIAISYENASITLDDLRNLVTRCRIAEAYKERTQSAAFDELQNLLDED